MAPTKKRLPLEGVRVLDFGMFWAGPFAGKWLADAGAEVIKVESCSHPDNLRILARGGYPGGEPGDRPWNRSGMVNERNRNKLGVTMEMGEEEGRDLFRELVKISDVVIENFSARVLNQWKLGYSDLRKINPGIILGSLYSQGGDGPESRFTSFGGTLEQLGGLTYITGYPDAMPGIVTVALPDPAGGAMGAGLILAALRRRRLTGGEGSHIDLSQRENVTSLIGEVVMDYTMNGRIAERMGNRDPHMAPHGCYRCVGDDEWVTVAVANDEEWARLCSAIGQPDLVADDRFATVTARHKYHDDIDAIITAWTSTRGKVEAMDELQHHGVTAGAVYNVADLAADRHLKDRGFWEPIDEPDAGRHAWPGRPYKLSATPLGTRLPSPGLGEHNRYVFGELLGISDDDIAGLEARGIIGTVPTEAALRGRL